MSQQIQQPGRAQPQASPAPKKPSPPFDIDNYLNPFVPRNPLRYLPPSISYWFGSRSHISQRHPCFTLASLRDYNPPGWYHTWHIHTIFLYFSILAGAFCGVAIIENVFLALRRLSGHTVPIVIASFGAAAILEYNTIESPLAQPRNLILGHFFAAAVGVGITKLFLLLPPDQFQDLQWLAGALAVGVASVAMSFSKTVHPPAGATALLAATNLEIQELGWWLLPLVLLASMLMLASALILNNGLGRRFPVYWWTPVDLGALKEQRRIERQAKRAKEEGDVEQKGEEKDLEQLSRADSESTHVAEEDLRLELATARQNSHLSHSMTYSSADRIPRTDSASSSQTEEEASVKKIGKQVTEGEGLFITKNKIVVPEWLELSDWEDEVLRILMERMRER